jgi:hypothetical protein
MLYRSIAMIVIERLRGRPSTQNPPVGLNRRPTMKYARMMFATIGLVAAAGATDAAQDQHNSVTLYTSATHAGKFDCNVVNVSNKALNITISIIQRNGITRTDFPTQSAMPGEEVSGDFGDDTSISNVTYDAYCAIQVSGTENRNDVRAALNTNVRRTFSFDGGVTKYPTFVAKVLEAH